MSCHVSKLFDGTVSKKDGCSIASSTSVAILKLVVMANRPDWSLASDLESSGV